MKDLEEFGGLSLIVPTMNSETGLSRLRDWLPADCQRSLLREIIISDGGSEDRTCALASSLGARLVVSKPGRGRQLAAGAVAATGKWMLFVHADTQLSPDWAREAARHIAMNSGNAGYFSLRFSSGGIGAAWTAAWANFRSAAFGLPYGDQGS